MSLRERDLRERLAQLVAFLADDALAATYQTLGQYRSAALRIAAGEGSEERQASEVSESGASEGSRPSAPDAGPAVFGEQRPRSEPDGETLVEIVVQNPDVTAALVNYAERQRHLDARRVVRAIAAALHREGAGDPLREAAALLRRRSASKLEDGDRFAANECENCALAIERMATEESHGGA